MPPLPIPCRHSRSSAEPSPHRETLHIAESVLENRRVQAPRVGRISAIMSRPGVRGSRSKAAPDRRLLAAPAGPGQTHVFTARGRRTDRADLPEHKSGCFMRTPAWCQAQAGMVGPACATLAGELLAVSALFRLRRPRACCGWASRLGADRPGQLRQRTGIPVKSWRPATRDPCAAKRPAWD
jgi:hypothetical protein